MARKNDNLPTNVEMDMEAGSSITYANEVVAIIAGVAASEVEGIASMCNVSGSLLGKNRSITRGVKVETSTEEASVDLYIIVEYGTPIQKAAQDAQESVRKAIEAMTGLRVVRVDVHVQGVSFEKDMGALASGAKKATLEEPEENDLPLMEAPEKAAEKAEVPSETEAATVTEETEPNVEPQQEAQAEEAEEEAAAEMME